MSVAAANSRRPEAARSAAPDAGLVEEVTTVTARFREQTGEYSAKAVYGALNRQRRVRRMRRVVVASADASRDASQRGGHRVAPVFVTLTYRPGVDWAREHVSRYIRNARQWLARRGVALRYQWVIELTAAGRPHYHVLLWLPPRIRLPKPDKAGWWLHGLSRIERAHRPVGYLVKYATKGAFDSPDHAIPAGARLFGCGNTADERLPVRRSRLPVWLAKITDSDQVPRRVPHVGFVCMDTGEIFRTPYVLSLARTPEGIVICFEPRG